MKKSICLFIGFLLPACVFAEEGRYIYLKGENSIGEPIKAYINDLETDAALPCVNCHRESGLGTSESGQTIPPVSWRFLGKAQPKHLKSRFYSLQKKRPAYTINKLHRLLTTGINSAGNPVDPVMPRYAMTISQVEKLKDYLETLFPANDPGVDQETIRIATIIDNRLPTQLKNNHRDFLQGLFDMKNALTRGELKRKRYAPIQKVPQYESYRKWDLTTWELGDEPGHWGDELARLYDESPVFVVLVPRVKENYSEIQSFCNSRQLPCLFGHNTALTGGDYFNFVFRDVAKQQKDYIDKARRQYKGKTYGLDSTGQVVDLEKVGHPLPLITNLGFLQQDFKQLCGQNKTIIFKSDLKTAQQLYSLKCPQPQQLQFKILAESGVSYEGLAEFVDGHHDPQICWVTDYDRVLDKNLRQIRVNVLAKRFGIELTSTETLAQSLFAFGLLADATHQLAGNFSRAYLMENIEHMLNSFPNYTYFNTVSGAPNQRSIVGALNEYCTSGGSI